MNNDKDFVFGRFNSKDGLNYQVGVLQKKLLFSNLTVEEIPHEEIDEKMIDINNEINKISQNILTGKVFDLLAKPNLTKIKEEEFIFVDKEQIVRQKFMRERIRKLTVSADKHLESTKIKSKLAEYFKKNENFKSNFFPEKFLHLKKLVKIKNSKNSEIYQDNTINENFQLEDENENNENSETLEKSKKNFLETLQSSNNRSNFQNFNQTNNSSNLKFNKCTSQSSLNKDKNVFDKISTIKINFCNSKTKDFENKKDNYQNNYENLNNIYNSVNYQTTISPKLRNYEIEVPNDILNNQTSGGIFRFDKTLGDLEKQKNNITQNKKK